MKYKSLKKKEMEVNSLFLITKAKLPARVLHQYSSREKKNEHNIRYASVQNFSWFKFIFFTREWKGLSQTH